jgi:hypothetical protein
MADKEFGPTRAGATGPTQCADGRMASAEAAGQRRDIRLVDPNRVELGNPGGQQDVTAAGAPEMIHAVGHVHEVLERYRAMEKGSSGRSNCPPVILIVDEYAVFARMVKGRRAEQLAREGGGDPSEHPVLGQLARLLAMGRRAGISVSPDGHSGPQGRITDAGGGNRGNGGSRAIPNARFSGLVPLLRVVARDQRRAQHMSGRMRLNVGHGPRVVRRLDHVTRFVP